MNEKKGTILVVDDDPNLLKAISLRLKTWGYEVVTAINGVDALTFTKSKKPDLVITDIWMPVGTGFSLAYRLRESLPEVPVLFLSASRQAHLKQMVQTFATAGLLEKPYEPEALRQAIVAILPTPPVINHGPN